MKIKTKDEKEKQQKWRDETLDMMLKGFAHTEKLLRGQSPSPSIEMQSEHCSPLSPLATLAEWLVIPHSL